MVISASLHACGVVFPFAMPTSICRSIVTICSGLYLLIGMTRFSSKWILSHSTWYKFRRSRQDLQELPELAAIRKDASPIESVEGCRVFELYWRRYVAYLVTEELVGSNSEKGYG